MGNCRLQVAKKLAGSLRPVLVSISGQNASVDGGCEAAESDLWKHSKLPLCGGLWVYSSSHVLLEGSGGVEMLGSLWKGQCGLGCGWSFSGPLHSKITKEDYRPKECLLIIPW